MLNLNDIQIRIVVRWAVLVSVHMAGARTDQLVDLVQLGDPRFGGW